MAAPSPPELPPLDLVLLQGFNVLPHRKLKESKLNANWGRFVFTKGIAPVPLRHFIVPQSSLSTLFALAVSPTVEVSPLIYIFSFTETGIPKRGGRNFSASHSSFRVQLFFPL
jgi:hypothetical protein